MRYRVLPYRQGSKGAKALAEALGGRVLKLVGSKFKPQAFDVIINWGRTEPSGGLASVLESGGSFFNFPHRVKNASNKLNFFNLMKEECPDVIPPYWTNAEEIPDESFSGDGKIVCRTVLAGHSGDGIVIASDRSELVPAPLYVQYMKKKEEYRIHVGRNTDSSGESLSIISVQRKAKRSDAEIVNWQVRNHSNGFVYVRQNVNPPSDVIEKAKKALEATGLDFGAVDVIYNAQQEKAYVLEVNTAPGLEGQTVEDYAAFFRGA